MSYTTIASFFTYNNVPKTGLSPTIRIWEVNNTGNNTLIIGTIEGTGDPGTGVGTDGIMVEIYDKSIGLPGDGGFSIGGSRDGFYSFTFTQLMGYDANKTYLVRVDGGSLQPINERYHVSNVSSNIDVGTILDEPIINHNIAGSVGATLNQTHADAQQLMLGMVDVTSLLTLLLKYDTNRTKIDTYNYTLTVYDDDCVTPLRTFKLLDSYGMPSVADVCERKPQAIGTSDNRPTCN